ncbi:hypothetical protein, partial [Rhizobium bangladeshense]|uniref:hypothetical protein n=1 Tax=Rhizobium bangladeshense TaxID=1138189 RepID=UPI000ADAF79A
MTVEQVRRIESTLKHLLATYPEPRSAEMASLIDYYTMRLTELLDLDLEIWDNEIVAAEFLPH